MGTIKVATDARFSTLNIHVESSLGKHIFMDEESMGIMVMAVGRAMAHSDEVAEIMGCDPRHLRCLPQHPMGPSWVGKGKTRAMLVEISHYGLQNFLDKYGEEMDHSGGWGLDVCLRLEAPTGFSFEWEAEERSDPAWMWSYDEDQGNYTYTRTEVRLVKD